MNKKLTLAPDDCKPSGTTDSVDVRETGPCENSSFEQRKLSP